MKNMFLDCYKEMNMKVIKKYRYIVSITMLLILMIGLVNHSPISLAISEDDKVLYALNQLIEGGAYGFTGQIISKDTEEDILLQNKMSLYFEGVVTKEAKDIKVYLENSLYSSQEVLFEYYSNGTTHLITTPIEQLSTIKINPQTIIETNDNSENISIAGIFKAPEITKKKVLSVSNGTYNTIDILTDCYHYKLTNENIYDLLSSLTKESIADNGKEIIQEAEIIIYIDYNLKVRAIEMTANLEEGRQIIMEMHINGYQKDDTINMPDDRDSVDLFNMSEEELNSLFLELTSSNNE
jgi:hypothetical protein